MGFAQRSFEKVLVRIARTARDTPGIAVMDPRRSMLE
jgi:hypothetical protein